MSKSIPGKSIPWTALRAKIQWIKRAPRNFALKSLRTASLIKCGTATVMGKSCSRRMGWDEPALRKWAPTMDFFLPGLKTTPERSDQDFWATIGVAKRTSSYTQKAAHRVHFLFQYRQILSGAGKRSHIMPQPCIGRDLSMSTCARARTGKKLQK